MGPPGPESAERPSPRSLAGSWTRARPRSIAVYLAAAAGLALVAIVFGHEITGRLDRFEAWVEGLGPWAPAMFVLVYAILNSVFVPDLVLGIVAGSVFGFTHGLALVVAGTLLASAWQYALARRTLRRVVARFVASRPALAAIMAAVVGQQLTLQVLIRLTPLNRALTSYALGALGVGFGRFLAASLALLPWLCLEVYTGTAGRHLARLAGTPGRLTDLRQLVPVVGLAMSLLVMIVVSRLARRALDRAAAASRDVVRPPPATR